MWPFHRHKYIPASVMNGTYTFGGRGSGTVILSFCRCEKRKTETISGRWTLEEILNGIKEAKEKSK